MLPSRNQLIASSFVQNTPVLVVISLRVAKDSYMRAIPKSAGLGAMIAMRLRLMVAWEKALANPM